MTVPVTQETNIELFRSQAKDRGFRMIPLVGKQPDKAKLSAYQNSWKVYRDNNPEFNEPDFQDCNAGVCCGPSSKVFVLDIDDPDTFDLLKEANGWDLPETYTVLTGNNGYHYYYRYPSGSSFSGKSLKHPAWSGHTIFDVKCDGGYVVAAGSVHPITGKVYSVERDTEIAEPPDWLLRHVSGESVDIEVLWDLPIPSHKAEKFLDSLNLNERTVRLILEGKPKGDRSETFWGVLLDLIRKGVSEKLIGFIFEHYPIGDKYREKGLGRSQWLKGEISRAKAELGKEGSKQQEKAVPERDEPHLEKIEKLNEEYAVVQLNGKTVIMKEIVEPTFNRPDVHFYSISDFNHWFANKLVIDPERPKNQISISKLWLKSPHRRQYQGIVFSPEKDVPCFYNLWRGFGIEPKQGDWSLMRDHIFKVIANGDQTVYDYIIHWMADLVQNPGGRRPGVSIVLRGEQGTGKGCFVTNLGQIVGNHFLHITNQRQLTGRFNQHLKDALLVFVDEGIWAGNRETGGILKAMITENRLMIEPKGKDIFSVMNHVRLIFASNDKWVVPAGTGDRRFLVLDVNNSHSRDRDWFKSIWEQMDNGGREAMLHDLLKIDLTGVELRDFPRTEARLEQIFKTMDTIYMFWLDLLQDGRLNEFNQWEEPITTSEFHENYLEFAKNVGDRFKSSKTQFGKDLRDLCPGMKRKRQTSGSREWQYHFPPLLECRQAFEKKVGQPINWD